MLTGKAKEDFNKWFIKHSNDFGTVITASSYGCEWLIDLEELYDELPENLQNTIIIEWFDYCGMPIFVNLNAWNEWTATIGNTILGGIRFTTGLIQDRQTANKIGIEIANELYNTTQ